MYAHSALRVVVIERIFMTLFNQTGMVVGVKDFSFYFIHFI